MYIYDSILLYYSKIRNVSHRLCTENQITHFVFNNFYSIIVPFYEVMWKSVVEPDSPFNTRV